MSDTDLIRVRIVRMCVCTAQDRAGGWGCCCSRPEHITRDPNGPYVLTPFDGGPADV